MVATYQYESYLLNNRGRKRSTVFLVVESIVSHVLRFSPRGNTSLSIQITESRVVDCGVVQCIVMWCVVCLIT